MMMVNIEGFGLLFIMFVYNCVCVCVYLYISKIVKIRFLMVFFKYEKGLVGLDNF